MNVGVGLGLSVSDAESGQLGDTGCQFDLGICSSPHRPNDSHDLLRQIVERCEVIAEYFDRQIGLNARDRFVHAHRHRLCEVIVQTRDLRQFFIQSLD